MNSRPNTSLIFRSIVEGSGESKAAARDWMQRVDNIHEKIHGLDPSDSNNKKQIAQLEDDLRILNLHKDRIKFWQNPRLLILDFIRTIRDELDKYDKQHPAKQSAAASRLIEDIKLKINMIGDIQAGDRSLAELHMCYFALGGLLWASLDTISANTDQPLEQAILFMLCQHRLDLREAKADYSALKEQFSLPELTENQNHERQIAAYHSVHRALDRTLRSIENPTEEKRKLINQAFDVIIAVKDFHFDCSHIDYSHEQKIFDYKFYTAILSVTHQLVNNPHDQAAKDRYHELITLCEDGKGSLKGRIAGAMLTLIGTIITVSAGLALHGGLMPLVPVCIVAGSTIAFSGMTLFSISTAGGPHKATNQFELAVKKQPVVAAPAVVADERTPLIAPRR